MVEIAVLGSPAFTLGFQMAGIKKIVSVEKEQAQEKIKQLMQDKEVGIIITDQESMQACDEQQREEIENSVQPVCMVLSTDAGSNDSLRKMIKKSIGVDLMKDE